jgi:hypothetical protein
MIGHEGPRPGRTPPPADAAPTLPLDGAIAPESRTEPPVPLNAEAPAHAGNQSPEDEHRSVDLARLAWLATVAACVIAVAILLLEGYYGYAAVTFAVAASAALNLT